ncbi:dolichol kinase [Tieghemiomyces parasiticus]|uniref:dolichol kinase n=1 Tax=Tieghemiomyces parasiticus TaxID=78921 RepID=A0A9W8E2A2_9FUNG|nr:dolichol kinase [Tieghemiomyces parasiticus]
MRPLPVTSPPGRPKASRFVTGLAGCIGRPDISSGWLPGLATVPLLLLSILVDSHADSTRLAYLPAVYLIGLLRLSVGFAIVAATHLALYRAQALPDQTCKVLVLHVTVGGLLAYPVFPSLGTVGFGALWLGNEAFCAIVWLLAQGLPGSFTLGELLTWASLVTLTSLDLALYSLGKCHWLTPNSPRLPDRPPLFVVIQTVVLFPLVLALVAGGVRRSLRRGPLVRRSFNDAVSYLTACGVVGLATVIYLDHLLGRSCLIWLFEFVTSSMLYPAFVMFWGLCLVLSIAALQGMLWLPETYSRNAIARAQLGQKALRNLGRKYYHVLVVLMFTPALVYVPDLLALALAGGWCILAVLELVRGLGLPPVAEWIDQFMRPFTDHHDAGAAILSHLYLLLGCAIPVWLHSRAPVSRLAGVLTLGIGDAVASVVGQAVGRFRWPGNRSKTVEGSLAFTVSVAIPAVLCLALGRAPWTAGLVAYYVAISAAAAVLEALTDQNDNLFIPLAFCALINFGGL